MALLLHLLLLLLLLLHQHLSSAAPISTEFLYPNITFSYLNFVDNHGGAVFLASRNATFQALIYNPIKQQSSFYLAIIHVPTTTVVWSANRNSPIPKAGVISLSHSGLSVSHPNGSLFWSTPQLSSPVAALRLLDTGNLLLLDASNTTLWQSFDNPTDTLVSGQALRVGSNLSSPVSDSDLSEGDYRLFVTADDAIMQWKGAQQYWSLSADARSVKDYNAEVSYMMLNSTGLYLFTNETYRKAVFEVELPQSDFWIAQLDSEGRFQIMNNSTKFVAPSSNCELPFFCEALGLCTDGSNGSACICPDMFGAAGSQNYACLPSDGSVLASSSSCGDESSTSFLGLGIGIGYVANKFATPISSGDDIASCRSLCSANCSCLGFFYKNSSGSCYLLEHQLGSLSSSTTGDFANNMGYIKTLVSGSKQGNHSNQSSTNVIPILLPTIAAFLLVIVLAFIGSLWWMRRRRTRNQITKRSKSANEIKLGRHNSWISASHDDELDGGDDEISIPGLPTRFSYTELEAATENFRTRIGSGGFGTVYKGTLPDKTLVAVKRIGSIGVQGKKEFCTEIAVIGKVHHVNLVKLRGFCAQGMKRLLVYEYMNRSSLDRSLFGNGPVLEWQERVDIAVGAARGLAYLHSGCEHKILHCDVKPENILLHDQGGVKISDFGLAKLLSPEQSGLFTTMRGTRGYLAPEWLTNSAISDRTDVYSYGMVLLEILRGRKNCSGLGQSEESELGSGSAGSGTSYFPLEALEMHEQGRHVELADPRLEGRVTGAEVERVVRVALCCLHEEPGLRPSMVSVVGMLERTMGVWEPRVESLNFLRFYGRGFADPRVGNENGILYGGNNTGTGTSTSSTTSGSVSYSYLSSQQVSGPR